MDCNNQDIVTENVNQEDTFLRGSQVQSNKEPYVMQNSQNSRRKNQSIDPFVANRLQKSENNIQLARTNYGSDDIIDSEDRQIYLTPTTKVHSLGKLHAKSKHHHHNNPKAARKSQIFPDPMFFESHQYQFNLPPKAIRVRVIIRVQQFIMNLIQLVIGAKDRFETIMTKKEYFNQVGDKSAFFNGIVPTKQRKLFIRQIKGGQVSPIQQLDLARGLPSFKQKQTIRVVSKPQQESKIVKALNNLKNQIRKIPLISQQSLFRRMWDMIHMTVLLYYFIFIPLLICFNKSIYDIISSYIFNYILVALLFVDILLNFNTTLIQQGKEIMERKFVIQYYMNNGLLADVISLVSLVVFVTLKTSVLDSQSMSVFLLAFYLRLSQFGRVSKKIELQYYFSQRASLILRLVKLLQYNLYIIHLISCLWILIARNQENISESWLGKYGIENEVWYIQFLNAFYFSTVTMVTVGYGDITASTSFEKLFSTITILSGCGVFAYSISEVGSIFKKMQEEQEQMKDNMIIINGYMKKKKIPIDLQCQIRHYLEYYWNESISEKVQKEQSIIDQLSKTLKENLKIEANRSLIQESSFFKNIFSEGTMNKIIQMSTEQRCHPEEIVYEQGDRENQSLYFIEKGSVQCIYFPFSDSEVKKAGKTINLKSKQYFGDIEFLTGEERIQQVRSLEFTTLIKIDREKFLQIVRESDHDLQKYCMIRDDIILNKNYAPIQMKCSYCFYSNENLTWDPYHFEQNCPLFHFIPNRKKLVYKYIRDPIQLERKLQKRQIMKYNFYQNIKRIQEAQQQFYDAELDNVEHYVEDNCILNETIFTDEDFSDSDEDSSENSYSDGSQISEEPEDQECSNSESSDDSRTKVVKKQDSYKINKQHIKQKSILSNKNKVYDHSSTLQYLDVESDQLHQTSIADLLSEDKQNSQPNTEANLNNFLKLKSIKKGSSIRFNLGTGTDIAQQLIGQETINLDDHDHLLQNNPSHEPQISPFEPKNILKDFSVTNSENNSGSEQSNASKQLGLKNSATVKFKLPLKQESIRKVKTLPKNDNLKKQITLKNQQKKGAMKYDNSDERNKSLFKAEKMENNLMEIKKNNKFFQKFITLMKSGSHTNSPKAEHSPINEGSKLPSLSRFFSQQSQHLNDLNNQREYIQQQFLEKKELIGQKIKSHMDSLQDGFQQIQNQLQQYNKQFYINSKQDLKQQGYMTLEQIKRDFDKMKNFEIYFPEHNFTKVIQHYYELQYYQRRKQMRLKKKTQTPKERQSTVNQKFIFKTVNSNLQL